MKICLLSSIGIYPERNDGPSVNAYNLAKNLQKLGVDLHVITGSKFPVEIKRSLTNDSIIAYPFAKDWGNYKSHDTASKYLSSCLTPVKLALRIPKITWEVCSVINNINPDIIFYNLVPLDPLVLLPFIYRYQKKIQVVRIPVWFPLELAAFSKNKVNIAFGTYLYKNMVYYLKVEILKKWLGVLKHLRKMKGKEVGYPTRHIKRH